MSGRLLPFDAAPKVLEPPERAEGEMAPAPSATLSWDVQPFASGKAFPRTGCLRRQPSCCSPGDAAAQGAAPSSFTRLPKPAPRAAACR